MPARHGTVVGSEHDVQVEHRDKRAEVTVAGGGEDGVAEVSSGGDVGVGSWAASRRPHARLVDGERRSL